MQQKQIKYTIWCTTYWNMPQSPVANKHAEDIGNYSHGNCSGHCDFPVRVVLCVYTGIFV